MHLRNALVAALVLSTPALAAESPAPASPVPEAVSQAVARISPDSAPTSVKPAVAAGLFEVVFGPEVVYVSADGRYAVRGDMIELESRVNLTEQTRSAARIKALEDMGEDGMIVFGPKDAKHTVTVFTDVDCPYCVKLHNEVPELNRLGIRVRYLAFPRAGLGSPGFRKTVSVWCSQDRNEALSAAKAGKPVAENLCQTSPVADHFALGQVLGVTGTPTLILDDGRLVPGYVPAARLAQVFDAGAAGGGN